MMEKKEYDKKNKSVPVARLKFDEIRLKIDPQFAAIRTKYKIPLRIVVNPKISEVYEITTSVAKYKVVDFNKTIGDALKTTFERNFTEIEMSPAETKQGLELIIDNVTISQDLRLAMNYTFYLSFNGKDIVSYMKEYVPKPITVSSTIFTYIIDTRDKVVSPMVSEEIKNLCFDVAAQTLMNQKLIDNGFWKSLE
jgi:hypothetical protein